MIFIIFITISSSLLLITFTFIGIISEKRDYNNGICKHCGKPLRHFDTDSQGGRLYTCPNFCDLVAVTYPCVDARKKEENNNE